VSTLGIPTNDVDEATGDDCPLAAIDVGNVTSCESTKEGTSRKDGHDKRSVVTADSAKTIRSVETLRADRALDLLDKKRGVEHTVDVPGVITCSGISRRNQPEETWTVNIPKKIPPKEAKAHRR
jgi:hypothetical protein